MSIRLRPEEIDHVRALLDARDSAHLAGWTTDPFYATGFQGGQSLIKYPGGGAGQMPTTTLKRLQAEGLFSIYSQSDGGMTFDLVDDIRDRIEELKKGIGLPSRLDELEAKAEADAQQRAAEATQLRHRRYGVFAAGVGRWARRSATIGLLALYLTVVGTATFLATASVPLAIGVAFTGVTALFGGLAWVLHKDGFAAAAWLEIRMTERVERWLLAFDKPD